MNEYFVEDLERVSPPYSQILTEFYFSVWSKTILSFNTNPKISYQTLVPLNNVVLSEFDRASNENHLELLDGSIFWVDDRKKRINKFKRIVDQSIAKSKIYKDLNQKNKLNLAKRYYLNLFLQDNLQEGFHGLTFIDFLDFQKYDFKDIYSLSLNFDNALQLDNKNKKDLNFFKDFRE